jgi:hypothetical protein
MGEYMDQIPEEIRDHVRQITKTSGLAPGEESEEKIAHAWLEKQTIFEETLGKMNMEEVDSFSKEENRGALCLTYSGSLLTIGPVVDSTRSADYTSIGLREDVPDTAESADSELAEDISIDEPIVFSKGPVKQSSAVFKIAVATDSLAPEEEEQLLSNATQVLTEEFVEVNKTIVLG